MRSIWRGSNGLPPDLPAPACKPGDRVAVLSQNNLEFVDLYGAVARLGAILVPINWRLSAEEIAYVIGDAAPKIIIADGGNQPFLQAAHGGLSRSSDGTELAAAPLRSRPTLSHWTAPIKILQAHHTPMPMPGW